MSILKPWAPFWPSWWCSGKVLSSWSSGDLSTVKSWASFWPCCWCPVRCLEWPVSGGVQVRWPRPVGKKNNNNNEDLERLTWTGPKRLHVLYKYILSKFDAYSMNAHAHECTHVCMHTDVHTCARTHTHTHTPVTHQGNETEEKGFKKRKVFKEDLKELTEVQSFWKFVWVC